MDKEHRGYLQPVCLLPDLSSSTRLCEHHISFRLPVVNVFAADKQWAGIVKVKECQAEN
jgi:hypothetical protein